MQNFITGLQFLTRIRIAGQSQWQPESFGRSVKYFPLVGGVIGVILVALNYIIDGYLPVLGVYLPPHVFATLLTAVPIFITGGLHCDGFMDTMDGLFSGRSRERQLEIMKDSRVGANGVTAFVLLILLKWSLIADIAPTLIPLALFAMPVLGRFAMVIAITSFPYARPEGMGKAFAQYAGKTSLILAALFVLLLIVPLGKQAIISGGVVVLFTILFARYVTGILGGLTGDIYGAITEIAEILVLTVFLF